MDFVELTKSFCGLYGGTERDVRIFQSPGRVNLIGEHTDYNGGYVFPTALAMRAAVALRVRNDGIIRLAATDLDIRVQGEVSKLDSYKALKWGNYQLGTAYTLLTAGYDITGCDMLYDETVPHGGGLSSSAAIEVATALAFATLSNEKRGITTPVDMVEMAKLSQKAENEYCGVNCGIMDQFASAMGKKDHAIFLNCKDLSYKQVPFNIKGCKLVISNTNKKRVLNESKYNERRAECESALEVLKNYISGINFLGDISLKQFEAYKDKIENHTVRNRAEHIIAECDRVLKSVDALGKGDIETFGKLMNQSHISLRDLYEVTGAELDALVEEAWKIEGTVGSRMTGAGFGGCTVSIVKDKYVNEFIEKVGAGYKLRTGLTASFYVSETGDGGKEIK